MMSYRPDVRRRDIHIVEPGGDGGIFQHAVEVADQLAAAGERVILHTASDAEIQPSLATACGCFHWYRDRNHFARRLLVAGDAVRAWRHINTSAVDGVLHVQGLRYAALASWFMRRRRKGAPPTVASPHNLFARSDRWIGKGALERLCKAADVLVVFSAYDARLAGRMTDGVVVQIPLVQRVDPPTARETSAWRERWGADNVVLMVAGQLRADKRIDLVVRAAALLRDEEVPATVALLGRDLGSAESAVALAEELRVPCDVEARYLPMNELFAAIAEADAVVCIPDRASQSGVLRVAKRLGTFTIASRVGGLDEEATTVVHPVSPAAIAASVRMRTQMKTSQMFEEEPVAKRLLDAYETSFKGLM